MSESSAFLTTAHRIRAIARSEEDKRSAHTISLPKNLAPDFLGEIASEIKSSLFQVVPVQSEDFDEGTTDSMLVRAIAASGVVCRRVYLLPHAGFAGEQLKNTLVADTKAGVDASIAIVSKLPFDHHHAIQSGFWIIDGSVVVYPPAPPNGTSNNEIAWVVTTEAAQLSLSTEQWNDIRKVATQTLDRQPHTDLEEPLVLSADLINGVAPVLCLNDHIDSVSCSWYHGAWQYLRLFDLVSTPTWHSEFYSKWLHAALKKNEVRNAAITGTADYSMLSFVHSAQAALGSNDGITVIDRCPTPLFACRWFANRSNIKLTPITGDLLEASSLCVERFALVATDALLTRFSTEEALKVLTQVRRLLVPGGYFVTTVRIHAKTIRARTVEDAIEAFISRAEKRSVRWLPFLRRSQRELLAMTERYAKKMISNPLGEESEILGLFQRAGFKLVANEIAQVPGELIPTAYVRIVAQSPP